MTSSEKTFYLRSLNTPVTYQKNIIHISVASLGCLAVIGSSNNKSKLWEEVTARRTDSVNKTLEVEALMEASVASTHNSLHLMRVTDTCEIFPSGNFLVLKYVK